MYVSGSVVDDRGTPVGGARLFGVGLQLLSVKLLFVSFQLVDALVDSGQVDIDGNPIFDVIPIASPATIAGAAASDDFFDRFEDPNDLHYNILSIAERRLIAEWLDVGAQYYNNPFDAPAN